MTGPGLSRHESWILAGIAAELGNDPTMARILGDPAATRRRRLRRMRLRRVRMRRWAALAAAVLLTAGSVAAAVLSGPLWAWLASAAVFWTAAAVTATRLVSHPNRPRRNQPHPIQEVAPDA